MASKFPLIIIDENSLKENLNKIRYKLKNENPGGLILRSSSKNNNQKLYHIFDHLLYCGDEWNEGRFKLSGNNGSLQLKVILSKKMK